jgi:hypothetical protein
MILPLDMPKGLDELPSRSQGASRPRLGEFTLLVDSWQLVETFPDGTRRIWPIVRAFDPWGGEAIRLKDIEVVEAREPNGDRLVTMTLGDLDRWEG